MQRWRAGSVKKQPGDGSFFHKTHSLLQSGFNTSRRALLSCACRLPGVDPAAMQSGSSPEPGGGGRSAEPPPGPCESPPAAGARWLPLAPVLLPSLGNAINTQRKLPSVHQRRRGGDDTAHRQNMLALPESRPSFQHVEESWLPARPLPTPSSPEGKQRRERWNKSFYPSHASEVLLLTGVKEKKKCDIVLRISAGRSFPW